MEKLFLLIELIRCNFLGSDGVDVGWKIYLVLLLKLVILYGF